MAHSEAEAEVDHNRYGRKWRAIVKKGRCHHCLERSEAARYAPPCGDRHIRIHPISAVIGAAIPRYYRYIKRELQGLYCNANEEVEETGQSEYLTLIAFWNRKARHMSFPEPPVMTLLRSTAIKRLITTDTRLMLDITMGEVI